MEWTRSDTLGLARARCGACHGLGLRPGKGALRLVPCRCVLRAIFRICLRKFEDIAASDAYVSKVALEYSPRSARRGSWGRKREEFLADFCLIARRTLTEEESRIFRAHFLLGADYRLCCRQLGLTKGNFFHAVYRIEEKLGRAFRELEPYALFPIDEYFHGMEARAKGPEPRARRLETGAGLARRVPLRRAA